MGIEKLVSNRVASVEKDEKKLFEHYHELTDPNNKEKFENGNFLGVKGGINAIADSMYQPTAKRVDALHEREGKDKLSEEEIRISALETLVYDNIKSLKGHEKASNWVKHFETLKKKDGFYNAEDREQTLLTMASDVLGWDIEKDKELNKNLGQFLESAQKGNQIGYWGALRQIREHTEKNLYGAQVKAVTEQIGSDRLLSQKAQAYFAKKNLDDHNMHITKAEDYFNRNFVQHVNDYHNLAQAKLEKEQAENTHKDLGYTKVDKAA